MHVLGIIPARGGSKGIPRKNIAPVLGRPLLAYTCDAAKASRSLTRCILSTDDPEIAAVGRLEGIEVPFLRPAALAADETPILEVLLHILQELQARESYRADVLVLLQPTSPLRAARHIDAAVDLLASTGADSVVTVVPVPHQFNPVSVMRIDGGRLRPFLDANTISRRQDKPALFARNGPAVLAVRADVIREHKSLYGLDSRPLMMAAEESADVDTWWDLDLVESCLRKRQTRDADGLRAEP